MAVRRPEILGFGQAQGQAWVQGWAECRVGIRVLVRIRFTVMVTRADPGLKSMGRIMVAVVYCMASCRISCFVSRLWRHRPVLDIVNLHLPPRREPPEPRYGKVLELQLRLGYGLCRPVNAVTRRLLR